MRHGIGRLRAGGSGYTPSDADAIAWRTAVIANGGSVSSGTLRAVDTFCIAAKASSYWAKLNRINLLCGDQLAAALVPLKVGGGSATETNNNFVSGDYTEATGLTGNGSTKYLNTGLVPSTSLALNDTHVAVYNRSSTAAAGGGHGAVDVSTNAVQLLAPFTDGALYSDQYNNGGGQGRVSVAVSTPYGFLAGTRTASNVHTLYRNGTSVGSSATTGGSLPALAMFICASNSSGTPGVFVAAPTGAYSIGSGLSGADMTAYNTHMQAFQSALGRNV